MTTRDDETPDPVYEGAEAIPDGPLDKRQDAAAREQGVRTERSDDLSSPRFTVHEDDPADQAEDDANEARGSLRNAPPD